MRDIKFSILLQHGETGRIVDRRFSYADLFNGIAKEEIDKLKRYAVIATRQFTGWNDHSEFAKEVYEGDIVKIDTYHGVVVWDAINDGWRIRIGNTYNLRNNEMVTVGNIYENPKLLQREDTTHA